MEQSIHNKTQFIGTNNFLSITSMIETEINLGKSIVFKV